MSKIFVQLVLFISIINFSYFWNKKSLIKKNYINKSLRSSEYDSDSDKKDETDFTDFTDTVTEGQES